MVYGVAIPMLGYWVESRPQFPCLFDPEHFTFPSGPIYKVVPTVLLESIVLRGNTGLESKDTTPDEPQQPADLYSFFTTSQDVLRESANMEVVIIAG